ncbi:hypothetical protein O3G_MSEX014366 [Manduca sexta]|uniref:Peroxisomal acyl-coenzyme A oxidase 3 n=1 Tax=Manduca sexta TaxID=7130 RepID=A0A921ZTJ9_MANSE|nr:hypothetical protein O3G_MSEX014366 [Manduca sexta]
MQESCHSLASAVAIAIRYAATRTQFGERDKEIPLIEYSLHQWRLFGYVSAAVVFRMFVENFTRVYLGIVEKSNSGMKVDNLSETVSEIHAMVSSCKPLLTWSVLLAAQHCREACGGHGFLKVRTAHSLCTTRWCRAASRCSRGACCSPRSTAARPAGDTDSSRYGRLTPYVPRDGVELQAAAHVERDNYVPNNKGDIRSNHEPTVTYEGDNNVLSQQAGNWLLRQYSASTVDSPLGTALFLNRTRDILGQTFSCTTTDQVKTKQCDIRSNHEPTVTYEGDNNVLSQQAGNWLLRQYSASTVDSPLGTALFLNRTRDILGQTFSCTTTDQVKTKQLDIIIVLRLSILYLLQLMELCDDLKGEVVSVVDALAPTDFVLHSVLGKSDGNLYQNLQKALFSHPGAFERASWWQQVVSTPASKL